MYVPATVLPLKSGGPLIGAVLLRVRVPAGKLVTSKLKLFVAES